MERRTLNVPAKLETREDGKKKISGYASVTYDGTPKTEYVLWDYSGERAVERVMPGAFNQALARPDDCRGLFNHDANLILGRTAASTMRLSVDGRGLLYEIDPDDTTISLDVQKHLTRKDVTGSSFAFIVDEERWTETKDESGKWNSVREILSVTLYDVGPVVYPAYETTTSSMRDGSDAGDAKKSLESHRAKRVIAENETKNTLNSYLRRARLVEIESAA